MCYRWIDLNSTVIVIFCLYNILFKFISVFAMNTSCCGPYSVHQVVIS